MHDSQCRCNGTVKLRHIGDANWIRDDSQLLLWWITARSSCRRPLTQFTRPDVMKLHTCSWKFLSTRSKTHPQTFHHNPSSFRVRTDSKLLFSRTFQDLQRPNSRVFQDSQNPFSTTFQDKCGPNHGCIRSKKCTYQISYQCNCITVKKPKCNNWN